MRRYILTLILIALPCATVAQATLDQPTGIITTDTSPEADAAIAVKIREILGELDKFDDVTVTVNAGIVTLRGETREAADLLELSDIVSRLEGVITIKNEATETTDIVERLNPAAERLQARVWQFVTFLPLALIAGLVFALIVLFGFFIARWRQPWERLAPNAFIAEIYRQLLRLSFILIGVVVALDILNATALLSTILGAAGIIGLALGFAVRDTVENFIASIMLSIRQPFRPNDSIEIGGDTGKVIRLTSRATILLSFDGNHIRIPNSTVFKSRIINFSRNRELRISFEVTVPPSAELVGLLDTIRATLKKQSFLLSSPEPTVWINDINNWHTTIKITAWIDQHNASALLSKGEALRQVNNAIAVEIEDRKSASAADPITPTSVAVSPVESDALEKIINEERILEQNENLLRDDGLEE